MAEFIGKSDYTPPSLIDVVQAAHRTQKYINETPLLTSTSLSKIVDPDITIHFKCEMFQKCGVYKFRGVSNSLLKLMQEHPEVDTVVTQSSGNHGQALAYGCKIFGLKCHVVMPQGATAPKVKAVQDYGAKVTLSGNSTNERNAQLKVVQENTQGFVIHPYDYFDTIAGQGTLVLEVLKKQPDIEAIIAPVGGGGMLAGIAIAAKGINPNIKVYGAEPEEVDDASQSMLSNERQKNVGNAVSIADGLMTDLGSLNWPILRDYVDHIITVSEKEISSAMFLIMERLKVVVEPSGATSYAAACTDFFRQKKHKNVCVILSGGNIDFSKMPQFLELIEDP